MEMTLEHATMIVKTFGKGSVTLGMQWMKMEIDVVDENGNPLWLTKAQVEAYYLIKHKNPKHEHHSFRLVCSNELSKLFV